MQDLWDTIKSPSLKIMSTEEMQTKCIENIFNKITEKFLNLEEEWVIQVQEALGLQKDKIRKEPPHVIITAKTLGIQNKERILRAAREKCQVTYKGKPIRITADFSIETLKQGRHRIIQALREITANLDYPAKLSSIFGEEIKSSKLK
jgi:hypothetical protein